MEQNICHVALHGSGERVEVAWADGRRESFHAMWLRDNCSCPQCRHSNGQKLTNISDWPADVRVVSAVCENGGLRLAFSPGNHSALPVFDAVSIHCDCALEMALI